jgi:Holliday junction resolvasome RuvABC endonuclease subunit
VSVLALDLATRTGWAFDAPGRPVAGTLHLPGGGGAGGLGGMNASLADGVRDLLDLHQPRIIVFEAPAMHMAGRSPHTARMLIYMAGVVELIAYRWSIPCFEAQVQTVRKTLGIKKGPTDKDWKAGVIRWAREQGHQPADDNQADALALLAYWKAVRT